MKVLILYTSMSATKNTLEIARNIREVLLAEKFEVEIHHIIGFDLSKIHEYDVLIIGTYTWGNGEIPSEMIQLYEYIEHKNILGMVTGIFGSGDTFYPRFCGAVDVFKYNLAAHSNLAVTLKVETFPQEEDIKKMPKFASLIKQRVLEEN